MGTPPGASPYNGYDAQQAPFGDNARNPYGFSSTPHRDATAPPPPYRQPHHAQGGPSGPSAQGGRGGQGGDGGQGGTSVTGGHNPLVRPYAMTGGRTRPRYQLAIEALVSTTADPARLQGQLPEHQRICRLCFEIKSVAEISALLSIPLGVARILVADLAEAGLVAIHQPGGDETAGGQPDVTLLERVLSGLRKL
ncbi:DUF742 domain-containing protein [Streptomyces sp. NPDC046203]|uniref:DUF742 domain-containing protein n=1 Tax=Streptomyces sp. NPDC046203 TaxID=3154602 RepID=UPI0033F02D79